MQQIYQLVAEVKKITGAVKFWCLQTGVSHSRELVCITNTMP